MRWPQFMRAADASASAPAAFDFPAESRFTRGFITVDCFLVMGLAFAFAFGNGWATAKHLGIHPWIAPLIQPAVDLAVVGLMVGLRFLAKHGWTSRQLRVPRLWMWAFGLLTLAMNTGESLYYRHWGRAAWDAIGPLLLIAWSELGPWLIRAIYSVHAAQAAAAATAPAPEREEYAEPTDAELEGPTDEELTELIGEEPLVICGSGHVHDLRMPEPVAEEDEEPEEDPERVVTLPEARRQAEVLRLSVRTHLIAFSVAGGRPWENVGKAIGPSVKEATGRTVTPRRINQIVKEEWASLYRERLVEEPYNSRPPVVAHR